MPDSKKRRSGLKGSESTVARLMGEAEQRQREQETHGRGKPGHGGQLGVDKTGRSKATYDLELDRQAMIEEMAQTEEVAKSDIVEAAIVAFYNAWKAGQVDLVDLKEPTRSLRAIYKLTIPSEFSFFSEDSQL